MTISQTALLSKPIDDTQIPADTLSYIKARGRQQAYNLIMAELKKSKLSQATLARRTGTSPEVISRILSRPRNIEQDTFSAIIFAITGGGVSHRVDHPTPARKPIEPPVVSHKDSTTADASAKAPPKIWQLAEAA